MKPLKQLVYPFYSVIKEKELPHDRFIRIDEVLDRVGFSRATLYRKINDPEILFPKQIQLSHRC